MCEKLREIFGEEPVKVGSVGLDVPEKIQGKKIQSRVKATVALLRSSDRKNSALHEGIIGDHCISDPSSGERRTEDRAVTIFPRPNSTFTELVWCTQETSCQDGTRTSRLCGTKPWMRPISEKREAGGPTVRVFSSAFVKCCTGSDGAAADSGACSKQATEFAQFSRHFGKDYLGQFFFLARIHRVEWRCGQRLRRVAACLQRLHATGQLRLPMVVAAENVPHVIGGSFCMKGRNCAVDVCWEVKKFNPSSVMHLYARDLEDLRSLVSSRGEIRMSIFVWTLRWVWG